MTDPRWRGIYKHGNGWRAVVSCGRGRPVLTKHFPAEASLAAMQGWRKDEQAKVRVGRKARASRGTFAGDAKRYLGIVAAMPTIQDRTQQIDLWIDIFGTRARDTVTAGEIRAQRDKWATKPRAKDDQRPFAASTINHRLRALSNLYAVLDGHRAENPVRDVEELREPDPVPRAMDYAAVAAIVAAMPVSQTKVRIRCLAYSQITPKQLMRLTAPDLDLTRARLRLPARAKGRGASAVWVPLLPKAKDAFSDFHQQNLYGEFSHRSLRRSWDTAAKKAGVRGARPYDLRHTYGTLVYRATRSREAVQQLLQHSSWTTSARYAMEAEDDVRAAHGDAVVRHFGKTGSGHNRKAKNNNEQHKRPTTRLSQRLPSENRRKH